MKQFYEKYCSLKEDQDFDLFRNRWSVIRLLRLRKQGLTHSKVHMHNFLNARANVKGIIGLISDKTAQKIFVLSRIERETINQPFCERLQLSPQELELCQKWCLDHKDLFLSTRRPPARRVASRQWAI